jgi:hypothetical protein
MIKTTVTFQEPMLSSWIKWTFKIGHLLGRIRSIFEDATLLYFYYYILATFLYFRTHFLLENCLSMLDPEISQHFFIQKIVVCYMSIRGP